MRRITILAGVLMLAGSVELASGQVAPPPGWSWSTDKPAMMTNEWNMPDSSWRFVQMAPGWHITTKPAATMYDPAESAQGSYALETVQILFPGTSQSGYGLFFGGKNLETGVDPEYAAFLIRRDGHATVEHRTGKAAVVVVPWTFSAAIQQVTGDNTARNVLRVSVGRDSVTFEVNASRVAALAKSQLPVDGHFGFRTGTDINLHITTLDHTRRLAPIPARQPANE